MSLQSRLTAFVNAVGADMKNLNSLSGGALHDGGIPTELGYLLFNQDLFGCNNVTGNLTAGQLYLMKFTNRKTSSITISKTTVIINTTGASLTNVGFALYSAAGALLTSSVNTNGATTGAFQLSNNTAVTITFSTPQTIAAGASFYVGMWMTGTTTPTLYRGSGISAVTNFGTAAPNFRFSRADTGLTTTPPANFGTQTGDGNAIFCAVG